MGFSVGWLKSCSGNAQGNAAYGLLDGSAFFVVRDNSRAVRIRTWVSYWGPAGDKLIAAFLRNHRKLGVICKLVLSKNAVCIRMNGLLRAPYVNEVVDFLNTFAVFLRDNGFLLTRANREEKNAAAGAQTVRGGTFPVNNQKKEGFFSKGTLAGVLGAFLGGAIGMIPWLLLSLLGYVAAVGGLAMAFAAYYGYKLLCGR